jgi:hypothetical protein
VRRTAVPDGTDPTFNLSTPYRPVALYLKDSDSIEYTRTDGPCVHQRVDEFLTLVLDMGTRQIIGFRLKGFRNFYMKEIKTLPHVSEDDFVTACTVLEKIMTLIGDKRFDDRIKAYKLARDIAWEDKVTLNDLPDAA